ncbi:RNA polymerase subunit sigma-70 [Megasphaera sueciensis]|uniref:RNA polymerase subunit sigma-70 n=1 Tax=Megasphaera sueciensis TaxID=349094 RepID=UPI003CFFB23E
MHHNDYVIVVRQYLIRYREFMQYIENIKADIEDLKAKLPLEAAPKIPSLSPAPGGSDGTSQQERIFFEKEAISKKIEKLEEDLSQIEPTMNRLNRSLDALDEMERMVITMRLINNESWTRVADKINTSESSCHRKLRKIVERLAGMMFGPEVIPVQTRFVFIDKK